MTNQISHLRLSTSLHASIVGQFDHDHLTRAKFCTNVKNLKRKIWVNNWFMVTEDLEDKSEVIENNLK